MINIVNKGVLDCDKPHAFAEGMTYPSLSLVDSKGHRKDLSVYQKKKIQLWYFYYRTIRLAMYLKVIAPQTTRRILFREDKKQETKVLLQEKMVPNVLYYPNQFLGTRSKKKAPD